MTRILCLILCLLTWPVPGWSSLVLSNTEAGSRHVYLLSAPIEQKVKGNCVAVGAIWALNLSWTTASVVGTYLCFHDPISAGMIATWDLSQDILYSTSEVRTANEVVARWRRRKDLREIAKATKAQEIRVITTGSSRQLGLFNATLDSKSFIFVETTSDQPPPAYQGKEWLHVGDVENTKVRMRFELPGYEKELPALEISLADLFKGTKIPVEVENAWRAGMKDWNKQFPAWERYVTHRTFNKEAKVTAELVKGGEALALGDYATGHSIKHMLGMSKFQRLKRFLDEVLFDRDRRETGPHLATQSIAVHDSASCSNWYRRLLGREVLVSP